MAVIDNANELTKQVLLTASKLGARLFRRNVGTGWIGRAKKITKREQIWVGPGDVVIQQARPFHNGEAGQFDTWGFLPVIITQEMVGTVMAQSVEIEIKFGNDRVSSEQEKWGAFCKRTGVRVGIAQTVEDAEAIFK